VVGVVAADQPAVVGEFTEGGVEAARLVVHEDGGNGVEVLAGREGVLPLVVGVVGAEQGDVGGAFAFAGLEAPPRAGLDLPQPGAAGGVGERPHRQVPAGGPTPLRGALEAAAALVTVGGPAQWDDLVTEGGLAPTALGEPVVVRPVQGQSVETAGHVGDAADGQGAHALEPEGCAALVDQTHPRAQETGTRSRLQDHLGDQAGLGVREPDRRTLLAPLPDRLVVAVGQAVADRGLDEALPRPQASVPGGGDLDEGDQTGPVLIGRPQPDRARGVQDGVQPELRVRPEAGSLECSDGCAQRGFPFRHSGNVTAHKPRMRVTGHTSSRGERRAVPQGWVDRSTPPTSTGSRSHC